MGLAMTDRSLLWQDVIMRHRGYDTSYYVMTFPFCHIRKSDTIEQGLMLHAYDSRTRKGSSAKMVVYKNCKQDIKT